MIFNQLSLLHLVLISMHIFHSHEQKPGKLFFTVGNKTYYPQLHMGYVNWYRGLQVCRYQNYQLASVDNQEENDAIFREAKDAGYQNLSLWTSGTDLAENGPWIWISTGSDIIYKSWEPNYPMAGRENCLYISMVTQSWLNWPCTSSKYLYALCQQGGASFPEHQTD